MQKIRQSSIVFEKPGIIFCLTSSNNPAVQYFSLNFAHVSYLPMSTKMCAGDFLFYLDLKLSAKIKKTWFLQTRFLIFY